MEWYESEDRRLFAETAAKYAEWTDKELEPESLHHRVEPGSFNWEMARRAGQAGLIAGPLPLDLGGAGLDFLGRLMVLERIARGAASAAQVLAVHWAGLRALIAGAEGGQARNWAQELGERATSERPWLCGMALPAAAIEDGESWASVKEEEAGFRLRGEFIGLIHPAVTERVVIVTEADGGEEMVLWLAGHELLPHCREVYPGTGLMEVPLARVSLPGTMIPKDAVLARGVDAGDEPRRELHLALAAVMAGNAAAACEYAWQYARTRFQTGRPIIEHQDVRRMLIRMTAAVEAARAMIFTAAGGDGDPERGARARRAFMAAGGMLEQVNLDAVQVLGGYGYMKDYGVERRLRDVKTIQCLAPEGSLEG